MSKTKDRHGNVPDNAKIALLIIDMISDFCFEDGEKLLKNALPAAQNLARLKKRAKKAGVPVIYVNDNFGRWQSDFRKLLENSCRPSSRGREITELLQPDEDDYFVLKPKHSGFYSTTLEILLEHLGAVTLILTGVATDICILFTANDAYMRDYRLVIPRDWVAAIIKRENEKTLKYMKKILEADTPLSEKIVFSGSNQFQG